MYNALFATIFAAVFAAAPAAWAQDKPANGTDVATLKAAVKADKKALVASTIKLSDTRRRSSGPSTTITSASSTR